METPFDVLHMSQPAENTAVPSELIAQTLHGLLTECHVPDDPESIHTAATYAGLGSTFVSHLARIATEGMPEAEAAMIQNIVDATTAIAMVTFYRIAADAAPTVVEA